MLDKRSRDMHVVPGSREQNGKKTASNGKVLGTNVTYRK